MPLIKQWFVSAALLLLSLAQAVAQEPDRPAPEILHLILTCAVTPCRFQQGEVMPVDLLFRADLMGYEVMTAYANRFEFGEQDTFTAVPAEGVIDPVGDAAAHWVAAGSWRIETVNLDPLSAKDSATLRLELNQWLYFTKPGTYKIQATSKRLSASDRSLELKSNPLEIQVIEPDPKWQRGELDRIVRALPVTLVRLTSSERESVRTLTYLGSDEALCEIEKRTAGVSEAEMDLAWRLAKTFLLQRKSRSK